MTPPFACISTAVLEPKVIEVIGTSPLTLLVYLQTLVDYRTGQRTRPYDHRTAAAELGVSLRTVNTYFKALVEARLIDPVRKAHGVDFTVVRREVGAAWGKTPAPTHSEVQESAFDTAHGVQESALHEVQAAALQPSRGKNPDSESTNQNPGRGGRLLVGGQRATAQPAALTPPDRKIIDFFRATLDGVEAILPAPLDTELLRTTASTLRTQQRYGVPALRTALLVAAGDVARGKWHLTPKLWSERIGKALAAGAAPTAPAGPRFPNEVSGASHLRSVFAAEREAAGGVAR